MKNLVSKLRFPFLLLAVVALLSFQASKPEEMSIDVAPSILNLANAGKWVTVHTDIPYSVLVSATITLNGVEIKWSKADNQGNFVAKFVIGDIKNLPLKLNEYNTLTMTCVTNNVVYVGSQDVKVISARK